MKTWGKKACLLWSPFIWKKNFTYSWFHSIPIYSTLLHSRQKSPAPKNCWTWTPLPNPNFLIHKPKVGHYTWMPVLALNPFFNPHFYSPHVLQIFKFSTRLNQSGIIFGREIERFSHTLLRNHNDTLREYFFYESYWILWSNWHDMREYLIVQVT